MPIYEYRCGACGHQLEALQKLSDSPLTDCPVCGKSRLTKLVTAAGFQLKGSGWYATDFKNSGAKPAGKNVQKSDIKADGGEAKSDTGSAAKSEPKSASDAPAANAGTTPASS